MRYLSFLLILQWVFLTALPQHAQAKLPPDIIDFEHLSLKEGQGAGMGLSITHGIVKNYGGFVDIHSKGG